MDDGKAIERKPKWWSRPHLPGRAFPGASGSLQAPNSAQATACSAEAEAAVAESADESAPEVSTGSSPACGPAAPSSAPEGAHSPAASAPTVDDAPATSAATTARPLHDPDPYGTPPYGRPGPWAPAPPVQLPAPAPTMNTPPHGVPSPPAPGAQTPGTPPADGHGEAPPPAQAASTAPASGAPPAAPQPSTLPPQQPLAEHQYGAQPAQYDPWAVPVAAPPPRRPRGLGPGAWLVLALLLALVAGAATAFALADRSTSDGAAGSEGSEEATRRPAGTVAGIAARALPGVVTITVEQNGETGTGTGFAFDDGHLLTNNHVVEGVRGSGTVDVRLSDGSRVKGRVQGTDPGYDLAVVAVDAKSAPASLALGDSDDVRVGEPVVAIGAPFGLDATVTSGIVSATHRPITAGGGATSDLSYVDALQTDAPINPGNSGGPLVNTEGEVVGINSAIHSAGEGEQGESGGSVGVGFAIPVNQAKRIAEELLAHGSAAHPVIGLTLDPEYQGSGVRVGADDAVERDGPADRAGIAAGDLITAVDGEPIAGAEELVVRVRSHRPGERVELTTKRDGKEHVRTVRLDSSRTQ